jgi:hypothetical protein
MVEPITDGFGARIVDRPVGPVADEIMRAFAETGIVWFSGCDFDESEFERMSDLLGPVSQLGTFDVYTEVAELGLHAEMAWLPDPPEAMAFWCAMPAARGGETTVCDGVALWQALSPDARSFFVRHRLAFQFTWQPDRWRWILDVDTPADALAVYADTTGVDAWIDGDVYHYCYAAPAVRPIRFDRSDAFANSVMQSLARPEALDSQTGHRCAIPDDIVQHVRSTAAELTVSIEWQRGDIVLLDNTRVMHGRRSYDDERRDLKVRCIPELGPWADLRSASPR